jgi:glycosyltransferase involved in cell wall biosynthesis
MRILLLTRYGTLGASSRLRAYQYLPYLRSQGFRITVMPLFGDYYQRDLYAGRSRRWTRIAAGYALRLLSLGRARQFDLLWIEYELLPWLPALGERLLARRGIPYVVDYDDAIYHRYELHPSRLVRVTLGKKIDVIMERAAAVVVGSRYLGDRARAVGAQAVEYLPTVVDLERYRAKRSVGPAPRTIGWIGSPSTVQYLSLVKPVLAEVCRAHGVRVSVVGAREAELDGVPSRIKPWSEATEVDDILEFDVGIMPLPDEPWERGKCGYKLIQYMACALPVVASPVGANREIVDHGVNGFLAATAQEWRDALEVLCKEPELGARLGSAGRSKVEAQYCMRVTAPKLAEILRDAAQRGRRG